MSDTADDQVDPATRATEARDQQVRAGADRAPTAEEEAAAERAPEPGPDVAEHYDRQAKVGAEIDGEGKID